MEDRLISSMCSISTMIIDSHKVVHNIVLDKIQDIIKN